VREEIATLAEARIYDALKRLRMELDQVNYLIRLLENMVRGRKQRGRPPKFLKAHGARPEAGTAEGGGVARYAPTQRGQPQMKQSRAR
jgi:hypothetical protein